MSSHNHSRRTVLKGLLASGCALCFPRAIVAATDKLSKTQAQYQGQPKGEQKCANCRNFVPPNSCTVVEGSISPEGWCVLWSPKG